MLEYLRLDGIDLLDYEPTPGRGREIARIEGLVGLGTPRGDSRARSEAHGAINRSRYQNSKIISIDGETWGATVEEAFAEYDEVSDAFNRTLEEGTKLLTWKRYGSLELQARVKAAGLSAPIEESAAMLRYQGQLEQTDPRSYSQTLRTAIGADLTAGGGGLVFPFVPPIMFGASAGGVANVVNGGKIETPPKVRIYGPVTSPQYLLDTSGFGVKITGEVLAGEYLEVDHANRTVKLNGTTLRMNLLDAPASRFFDVPRGPHTIRLLAINFGAGAHIEVETRDAYAG